MGVHGKNTVFKLDNSGGSLQDLSTYITDVSFPRAIDKAEDSGFGATYKSYKLGLADATIQISGRWHPTMDAHINAILGLDTTTYTFEYGPEGGTASKVKYTGECYVTDYECSSPIGDIASFTATLQVSGAVSRTTF